MKRSKRTAKASGRLNGKSPEISDASTRAPVRRCGPKPNTRWHKYFLETLRLDGRVCESCRVAGINPDTAYEHKKVFPKFASAWKDIMDEFMDAAEKEMYRRAVHGYDKPVFQGGEMVGHIREHSDNLLMFMLKGRRRDIYGDKVAVDSKSTITMTESEAIKIAEQREVSIIATMKAAAGIIPAAGRN